MPALSVAKERIKFVLLEGVHQNAIDVLQQAGYSNIVVHKTALEGEQLLEAIADAHFIGIRSRTQLTADVLKHAHKLIAIGCFCIGTNQVDLEAAQQLGIPVFNAPFSNTRSVAELVLGQIILLMRNAIQANAQVHKGIWNKSATWSNEVRGKTLGIVGYGHIGSQLSVLAEGLGMRVQFYDLENKLPLGNAKQVPTLNQLLETSDVVSLHVPENETTFKLINANIHRCKDGAILINAARGTVVDIAEVVKALESKKLRGAAFDVFPVEPKGANEEFVNPLRQFDNVFLTPHIGGSTTEAQANIGTEVANKFVKYSDNGSTITAVNFPEVSLPNHQDAVRLLHIHENRPGMLNAINKVFVEHDINIAGQFLSTNPQVGYVVLDVNAEGDTVRALLNDLKDIPGTIKARVLF